MTNITELPQYGMRPKWQRDAINMIRNAMVTAYHEGPDKDVIAHLGAAHDWLKVDPDQVRKLVGALIPDQMRSHLTDELVEDMWEWAGIMALMKLDPAAGKECMDHACRASGISFVPADQL